MSLFNFLFWCQRLMRCYVHVFNILSTFFSQMLLAPSIYFISKYKKPRSSCKTMRLFQELISSGLFWSCLVHYHFLATASAAIGGNETDHQSLLEFKAKITGDPLGVLTSWNASTHFCSWYGITCSPRHQRVTIMDLSNSKLSGSISPNIGNLSFLRQVQLQNNSFTSLIPPQIGRLRRLQILFLNNNSFQGTIPSNISACSELAQLIVGKNQLVGEIPMELGSLSKLWFLHFGYNSLSGYIPASFGNLSSLKVLQATANHLVGSIPNTFGQLKNLIIVGLGGNMLTGTIPLSIFNLSSITQFDITQNQIHGTIPSNLGHTLPNLQFFSIAYNQFTGSIPTSISNASHLTYFQVNSNSLSGGVPSLEKLHKLQFLRLTANHFGSGGDEDLSFICSLSNATSLLSLSVNGNNFGGAIPECITNLSTTLEDLLLDHNNISGTIPAGIGNFVNLERLEMRNNQLSGDIPHDFGKLQKLRYLLLNENNLSGKIPSSLGNLQLLIEMYLYRNNLQGSIPSSLGQCQNLIVLSLFSNNLSGSIPPEVTSISSLSIALALSYNQLSGALPMEVENLKNLGYLDVSENLLSGEIPNGLGSCIKLEKLILSGNSFNGNIPSSLSSLRGLEKLDLSRNNLSGKIPEFLVDFSSLQTLNLSYNNFEGMIPVGGVLKNASATLVSGNSRLCGGIPELQLPKCNSGESKKRSFTLIIMILLITFSVLIVVTGVLFYLFSCNLRKQKVVSASTSSSDLWKMSYQDVVEATDGFASANMIGMGGFGSVYKGVLHQEGTVVAIKVLNLLRPGAAKSFKAECEAMRNIRHRNLVKVLTTCSSVDYSGNDFKALVYEFMTNGSLEEWLHPDPRTANTDKAPRELNLLQRLNIVIDVANALDYLHHYHHQSPIVHCDLKPSNVLLDSELVAHVGDFGLARFLQDATHSESSSIAIKGTIGYTAPEYGMGSEVSTYGDVYSFGILLLEVFTGKRPTHAMFKDGSNLHNLVKTALTEPEGVTKIADPTLVEETEEKTKIKMNHVGTRHSIVLNCLISIFGIGVACSAQVQRERLCIDDVATQLIAIRDKLLASQYDETSYELKVS